MYEELVKRLRDISSSDNNIKSNYIGLTMIQAADVIEELQTNLDAALNLMKRQNGYIEKLKAEQPRWIPVMKRLPKKYHQVLVYGLNGMQIDCYSGEKSIGGRPLFMISEAKVTHWMPLPKPPKEET